MSRPAVRGVSERNALVVANLPLVEWALARFYRLSACQRTYPREVARSDATEGLIRAAELYEPGVGRFATYAWRWMWQYMDRGRWRFNLVRLPDYRRAGGELPRRCVLVGVWGDDEDLDSDKWFPPPADAAPSPQDAAAERDLRQSVNAAVARLPERERRVVEMRMAGLTLAEIAAAIKRSKERVRQLQNQAHERLRQELWILQSGESAES